MFKLVSLIYRGWSLLSPNPINFLFLKVSALNKSPSRCGAGVDNPTSAFPERACVLYHQDCIHPRVLDDHKDTLGKKPFAAGNAVEERDNWHPHDINLRRENGNARRAGVAL
ncbi:hypothetical protein QF000_005751 [Paraburkholderia atlantica]|uniref:hypothetical protein n=1 Tax=Paraburkholderia atlantica TaxID=2654982 RepID=UPI003D19073C